MIGKILNTASSVASDKIHQSTQVDPANVAAGPSSSVSTARVQTHHMPLYHADLIPYASSVGQDEAFQKVCSLLRKDNNGIIGIYGMGGVGKTTLMKKVHNEFLVKCNFDVIIWILVSQEVDDTRLLRSIMAKLGLAQDETQNEQARVLIYNKLLTMKFVLLIDDIWEPLDMVENLGIPYPTQVNKSKVIFTTRSEEVCAQMHPRQQVKVNCLGWNDAWILFKENAGEKIIDSHPRIRGLAEQVTGECGGLPLALKVIGRTMAGKCTPQEWEYALTTLRKSPSEIVGTEKKLFSCLKFNYDALPNPKIKDCFLYCCLFPEDSSIHKEKLIDYWVGEGFLGINESLIEAKNNGHAYLSILKASFLLESEGEQYVKMHDVIRDMALWIVSEYGKQQSKFFVHPSMPKLQIADRWKEAHRIFLVKEEGIPEKPVCPRLSTLIIWNDITPNILDGLFNFMPLLRVLDLSFRRRRIVELSPAIGQLVTLRYLRLNGLQMMFLPWLGNLTKLDILDLSNCCSLIELPNTIGQLVELRHLNLQMTRLRTLPEELGKLSKLEILNLRRSSVKKFPTTIGKLTELRYLDLGHTRLQVWPKEFWELKNLEHLSGLFGFYCKRFTTVELCKFANLRNLKHLEIRTNEISSLQGLSQCLTTLWTEHCPTTSSMKLLSLFRNMNRLSNQSIESPTVEKIEVVVVSNINTESTNLSSLAMLQVVRCYKLTEIEVGESSLVNLKKLEIIDCALLKYITGLKHLQGLEELKIVSCDGIKEVISTNIEETGGYICFPRLKELIITNLYELKSICSDTVSFPSLEKFYLDNCSILERLPLGLMNENRTLRKGQIRGRLRWIEGLKWQDDNFKSFLLQYYHVDFH